HRSLGHAQIRHERSARLLRRRHALAQALRLQPVSAARSGARIGLMALDPQLTSQLALAFAGALMGALFGGFARWTGAHNDRRLRLTLDLYNEFHSPLFNHVRIAAHDALSGGASMPAAYAS